MMLRTLFHFFHTRMRKFKRLLEKGSDMAQQSLGDKADRVEYNIRSRANLGVYLFIGLHLPWDVLLAV